jgi:hypothetical protein
MPLPAPGWSGGALLAGGTDALADAGAAGVESGAAGAPGASEPVRVLVIGELWADLPGGAVSDWAQAV